MVSGPLDEESLCHSLALPTPLRFRGNPGGAVAPLVRSSDQFALQGTLNIVRRQHSLWKRLSGSLVSPETQYDDADDQHCSRAAKKHNLLPNSVRLGFPVHAKSPRCKALRLKLSTDAFRRSAPAPNG